MEPMKRVLMTFAILVLLVGGFYFVTSKITNLTGFSVAGHTEEDVAGFVSCLNDNGAVLYISSECSSCDKQRNVFEDSIGEVKIVSCVDEVELCEQKDLVFTKVPVWEVKGNLFYGEFSLNQLSRISGCKI